MHSSLKIQTNLTIIIACALGTAAISILSHPFPAILLIAGTVFGLAVGFMQSQSITIARDALLSAETSIAVRQALTATTPGKRAIQVQWLLLPIVVASAFWIGNPLGAVAGYAIFICVRDLTTLKAVVGLAQNK